MELPVGLEPRRRGLRIVRLRALLSSFARSLIHSTAPPLPQKPVGFSGIPFIIRPPFLVRYYILKHRSNKSCFGVLELLVGLEPTACALRMRCSTN